MIHAVHAILYAGDPDATRAFFRETLGLGHVDAGGGWLIFALPPAELGVHPAEGAESGRHELYLMCDDIERTVAELKGKGVEFTRPVMDRGWGLLTAMKCPGLGELFLYQPRHPMAAGVVRAAGPARAAAKRGGGRRGARVASKKATRKAPSKKAGKKKVAAKQAGRRGR